MCSTSRTSASSSIDVPREACSCSSERRASPFPRRPPYPTAMLTITPSTSRVSSAASLSRRAVSAGSRSRAPTGGSRQRPSAGRAAHGGHPPAALVGQVGDRLLDDQQQLAELLGRPVEVLGGQQPQRDDP